MEVIVGIIALALAALVGTGKLNLASITSLFKTTAPVTTIDTSAFAGRTDACKAVLTLMQYTLITNGDMEPVVAIARSVYYGEPTHEA